LNVAHLLLHGHLPPLLHMHLPKMIPRLMLPMLLLLTPMPLLLPQPQLTRFLMPPSLLISSSLLHQFPQNTICVISVVNHTTYASKNNFLPNAPPLDEGGFDVGIHLNLDAPAM
jgi:hypothetical protein